MNILGHSYIAVRSVPKGARDLLIVGALLPESSPFIRKNPFSWEEIHEGGERLLEFLDEHCPEKRDLALGIMAHSVEFGADQFNKEIEKYAGPQRRKLAKHIAECSGIDLKTAAFRLHNFLWWGVDVWLLRRHPDFAREVQGVIRAVDIEGISGLLATAFQKEPRAVERTVRMLFEEVYRPEDLGSVEGLASIWARQAAGLPEKDRVNVPKAAKVFKECARLLENDWQNIVGLVETKVGENLRPLSGKERMMRDKEREI